MYYRGAGAAIVVYDISQPESFEKLQIWVKELIDHGPLGIVIAIAGNKADLEERRAVPKAAAQQYATENGFLFTVRACCARTQVGTAVCLPPPPLRASRKRVRGMT